MSGKKKSSSKKQVPRLPHEVEIDEPSQWAADQSTAFSFETDEGTDALAEELGEEFVENVTGANDAASEHRDNDTLEEQGSFQVTAAETEYADDIDASNPPDAEAEAQPTV